MMMMMVTKMMMVIMVMIMLLTRYRSTYLSMFLSLTSTTRICCGYRPTKKAIFYHNYYQPYVAIIYTAGQLLPFSRRILNGSRKQDFNSLSDGFIKT